MRAVDANQTPRYSEIRRAGHNGGDFLFVPVAAALATPTPSSRPAAAAPRSGFDARTMELEFWQSIKESDDPVLYRAYLQQYPNGAFATIARLRLRGLERPAAKPAQTQQSMPAKKAAPPPKRPKPAPGIAAATLARPASGFDGRWRGRATLSSGPGNCPARLDFEIEFSGRKFSGTAKTVAEEFQVQGALTGPEKFEGLFYNSRGMGEIEARFLGGKWRGSWDAEGECDGQLTLARAR